MNPLDNVLMRLDRAKKSGKGYMARCPSHQDRGPSLSVSEGEDGRVLMHCFAGCSMDSVLGAIGLQLFDLFPPSDQRHRPPPAPGISRSALRAAVEFEELVLKVVSADRKRGRPINEADLERERVANSRVALGRKSLA